MNNNNVIEDYLSSKGIFPALKYKNYNMYHAPYREDRTPSMKVQGEVFMDFGTGIGGGLKKLKELMDETSGIYIPQKNNLANQNSISKPFQIVDTKDIGTNPVLNEYLVSRFIDVDIAKQYCKEVYYTNGKKSFFAIGLPTVNPNSFAIRNLVFKGKIGGGISYFQNGFIGKRLKVFEGMFSMLSYFQTFKNNNLDVLKGDVLVLNSISNMSKIADYIDSYPRLELFLDRDEAGVKATQKLLNLYPESQDCSELYNGFIDMNESLKATMEMVRSFNPKYLKKSK